MLATLQTYLTKGVFYKSCIACSSPTDQWLCVSCSDQLVYHPKQKKMGEIRVLSMTHYSNPVVQRLLHRIKFSSDYLALDYLKRYVALAQKPSDLFDVAIPIPLHTSRQRKRGFNQVKEVFTGFCLKHEIPMYELLVRHKNTLHLSLFDQKERADYVENMFAFKSVLAQKSVAGKNVLLLDDIATSGSTLAEATKCLQAAGASLISAYVIAQA